MFVRVIEGQVVAKPMLRNAWDQLNAALAGHDEWLWSTGGIHRAGFTGTLAFSDQDACIELSQQPLIEKWVEQLETNLDLTVSTDCHELEVLLPGGEFEAGFVQFIGGSTANKARMSAVLGGMQEMMREHRPDILGSHLAWLEDSHFLQTVYFTSEHEAHAAENREFPGGLQGMLGELMNLIDDVSYRDIKDPWLAVNDMSLDWFPTEEPV